MGPIENRDPRSLNPYGVTIRLRQLLRFSPANVSNPRRFFLALCPFVVAVSVLATPFPSFPLRWPLSGFLAPLWGLSLGGSWHPVTLAVPGYLCGPSVSGLSGSQNRPCGFGWPALPDTVRGAGDLCPWGYARDVGRLLARSVVVSGFHDAKEPPFTWCHSPAIPATLRKVRQ